MAQSLLFEMIQYIRSRRAKYLRIIIKSNDEIIVTIPAGVSQNTAIEFVNSKQKWITKQLNKFDHRKKFTKQNAEEVVITNLKNAKDYLRYRLTEIAEKHGFKFNRIFIRTQRTRWGSCSIRNNINLNLKILTLPKELQDYIMIHELVHTIKKNHQIGFWNEMKKYFDDPYKLAKEVRKYNLAECKVWLEK